MYMEVHRKNVTERISIGRYTPAILIGEEGKDTCGETNEFRKINGLLREQMR
jgi:hypothetical protein